MPKTCEIENCEKQTVARGLCMGHYRRLLRNGATELKSKRIKNTVETVPQKGCSIKDCERRHYGKGFCLQHLNRFNRNGDAGTSEFRLNKKQGDTCKHVGCSKKPFSKDFCSLHFTRFRKHGDSNIILKRGRPRIHAN